MRLLRQRAPDAIARQTRGSADRLLGLREHFFWFESRKRIPWRDSHDAFQMPDPTAAQNFSFGSRETTV